MARNMTFHKGSNYGYNRRNKTEDPVANIKTQVLNITKSPHKGHFKVTLKKVWFLSAAKIHRSATKTAFSTLALSFGFPLRAGITVVS
jgi:hypothetical protein